MRSLSASLRRLASVAPAERMTAVQTLYQDSVMYLLRTDPFYGRALSRLQMRIEMGKQPLGIRATATDWQLVLSPVALAQTTWTGAQWLAMLRHTVLHLLWQHPERYATAMQTRGQAGLVRWATDAAVNDFLADLPATAITSHTLHRLTGQPVRPRQDSNVYWQQLRTWQAQTPSGQELQQTGPNQAGNAPASRVTPTMVWDDHQGWQTGALGDAVQREQWRQQLFATTAAGLTAKQRGTLPGAIQAALTVRPAQRPLNWRGVLQRRLGQVPAGRQPAYGRFNRRQPQRMELPGQTVQTWQAINIFVDQSGSMGNREISYLLGQLSSLLAIYPATLMVYPFDTVVHVAAAYRFTGRVRDVTRVGGGGTRFQAIFEALPRVTRGQSGQLTIILTDGYGEASVQQTVPGDVIWLLTSPLTAFSVTAAPGTVISLADDPSWQALREEETGQ